MSEQTVHLLESVRQRLKNARKRLTLVDLFYGGLLSAGIFASVFLLAALFEAMFWMPSWVRLSIVIVAGLGIGAALILYLLVPVLRNLQVLPGRDDYQLARSIGRAFPDVGDRLVNLLQLSRGAHTNSPDEFIDKAVRHLGEPIREVPFEDVATFRSAWASVRLATIPLVLLLLVIVAAPGTFFSASQRLMKPATTFERPSPFTFNVTPGNTSLVGGSNLEVGATVLGESSPGAVSIETRFTGEIRSSIVSMQSMSVDYYTHQYAGIKQPFKYRIVSDRVVSPWYTVDVSERPLIRSMSIRLTYPSYTRIPPRRLADNVGDITALRGTRVDISIATDGAEPEAGTLTFESGRTEDVILDSGTGSASFRIQSSDVYKILLESPNNIPNANPIPYRIDAVADASPSASFLAPELLVDLTDEQKVGLLVHITDDYGFRQVTLHYRLADSRFGEVSETFESIELPVESPYLLDQEISYLWDLSDTTPLDPVPGDVIEYYVEVHDNDAISGYKAAQTAVQKLRVPSLAEQYESLDQEEDSAEDIMEKLREEADRVREDFESLRDDLRQQPEADWQDERRLDQLKEQQDQMGSAVDDLSEKMQNIASEMSQNELVSEETMQTFEELRDVVEEVRTPELSEALKDLQSAIEEMNPKAMQEALEDFQFNEEMYQQRLDRTLNLFKQFRVQQDLEEIQNRAQDLSETEDRLAEETAAEEDRQRTSQDEERRESDGDNQQSEGNRERLAQEQEMSADEMRDLEEKMVQALERMEELENTPSEDFQDLTEDTQDQNLPQKMEDNAGEIRENNLQNAQQRQKQMSESLQSLKNDVSNMQMSMQGAQMQVNIAGIRSALEDVLTLSQQQETLRHEITDLSSDSPLLRPSAQDQSDLSEGLRVVSDSLQQIAQNVPQMSRAVQQQAGDALREMASSTDALTERQTRRASTHQRGAMTSLNELALMLSELMDQMMNGSGQGQSNMSMDQMMQQLQQMGQQQQNLNQQIQQLLNDAQGNRLTQDMMERLRQLGQTQEQIRQDLRQLARERDARNKLMGDLNRIAEQMAESIEELRQNNVSRRTVQRQQQILTRLLEASRSLQQRGKDTKREGRTANEILRESPAELTPSEQAERLRRDLIRALETGYSTDYKQLIRRYFDLLQSSQGEVGSETGS